jgi:type I restriction enzyme, S subunit
MNRAEFGGGEGMSEWEKIPLSKTTNFVVDNRGKTAPTDDNGIPLIATNCVNNNSLYPSYENLRYVSQETYDNWFRSHPQPADILLTLKGSQNGAVCLVPDPVGFVIAQDMVALRANENVIDPLFLFAALRSPDVQSQIKNLDVSGVIPHLKKSDFDKVLLPYPEPSMQKAIGEFYFILSRKIDLLYRQNKTLESIAETLFRQWFVEDVGEGESNRVEGCLGDVADNIRDSVKPADIRADSKYIGLEHIDRRDIALKQDGLGEDVSSNKYAFQKRDILFGKLRPYFHKVCFTPFDGICSTDILVIRPKQIEHFAFCLFAFFLDDVVEHANLGSGGTRMPRTDWGTLKNYPITIPDVESIKIFNKLVLPSIDKISCNLKQIQTLEKLRDTLLPKLMSGEVRVEL